MKLLHTWVFYISIFIGTLTINGQESAAAVLDPADSLDLKSKLPISFRFGVDLFRIVRSQATKDFQGFEAVADFRISEDLYIST